MEDQEIASPQYIFVSFVSYLSLLSANGKETERREEMKRKRDRKGTNFNYNVDC